MITAAPYPSSSRVPSPWVASLLALLLTVPMPMHALEVGAAAATAERTRKHDDEPKTGAKAEHTIGGQPGAPEYPPALRERIAEFLRKRAETDPPRTRHLRDDGGAKYTNRLILENSPYLLQHAHNPVDWHPWGDDAFALAQSLGRPVLLSVGYTTCHWCHVMEEESFEDPEIARYINEHYVAIKVDRERRPDVDAIYMDAVRMFSRRGGWPMTVAMTPAREPFFGGTYFPARDGDRGSGVGFLTILQKLHEVYTNEPERIAEVTRTAVEQLRRESATAAASELPTPAAIATMAKLLENEFDSKDGGFGRAPKFPRPTTLDVLLRYHRRSGDEDALRMVQLTLDKMAGGGMYDHVGSGFHRYSTDAFWLVPHFEKMLYDNAQLASTYLDAHRVTKNREYARIATDLLDYVLREMSAPGGGFYSATDADSKNPDGHTEEGWFFTWTPAEIDRLLSGETKRLFLAHHPMTESGNFEGRNILHAPNDRDATAAALSIERVTLDAELAKAYAKLYAERETRPKPILDDKVLTGWNGLMISAMVDGALTVNDPKYLTAAVRAAEFLEQNLVVDGALQRSWRRGEASLRAVLDDYAFVIAAYLDLFEATSDPRWFDRAVALQATLDAHFWDESGGGYYLASDLQKGLLVRQKPSHDGAIPSGNSVATLNLVRLTRATTNDRYRAKAARCLRAFAEPLARSLALPALGSALDAYTDPGLEIILVRPETATAADVAPFLAAMRARFLPNALVIVTTPGEIAELKQRIPLVAGKTVLDGKVTAYVCERGVCQLPTHDPAVFAEQIAQVHPYAVETTTPSSEEGGNPGSPEPSPTPNDGGGEGKVDGGR